MDAFVPPGEKLKDWKQASEFLKDHKNKASKEGVA